LSGGNEVHNGQENEKMRESFTNIVCNKTNNKPEWARRFSRISVGKSSEFPISSNPMILTTNILSSTTTSSSSSFQHLYLREAKSVFIIQSKGYQWVWV